jgi:translation initiation factor 3 subunit L
MLRRYSDAIKLLSHILQFLARARVFNNNSSSGRSQNDITAKKIDKMYALLAICVTLCPQRVEESVHTALREKYGEQMYKMQKGHGNVDDAMKAFEESFFQASPKFLAKHQTLLTGPVDAAAFQAGLLLRDVRLQLHIPVIRSYLRLYSTISMEKLASFLEISQESLAPLLLSYKMFQRQKRWVTGPLASGEVSGPSELDFYIDNVMLNDYMNL